MVGDSQSRRAGFCLATTFYVVTALGCAMVATPVLERYEADAAPVVRDFRIASIERRGSATLIAGDLRKVRDCAFEGLSFYAGDADDATAPRERLRIDFLDRARHLSDTGEISRQPWGPWRLHSPVTAAGPDVFAVARHRCHPLYETRGVYLRAPREAIFPE